MKPTEEQINKQIEKGKKFIEEHLQSAFGDDNVEQYEI